MFVCVLPIKVNTFCPLIAQYSKNWASARAFYFRLFLYRLKLQRQNDCLMTCFLFLLLLNIDNTIFHPFYCDGILLPGKEMRGISQHISFFQCSLFVFISMLFTQGISFCHCQTGMYISVALSYLTIPGIDNLSFFQNYWTRNRRMI